MKKWFIIAAGPGWRRGPAPSLEKRKEMIRGFDEWYENVMSEILPSYHGQEAMDKRYEGRVKIPWIGPKIATVYLRDIIYHFNIWSELRDYLPIHKPRVEFDYFCYVGAKFCSFYLCNCCWIKDFCMNKSPLDY